MLEYNEGDFHLSDICEKMVEDFSKFSAKDYYVYGLADLSKKPHVSIGMYKPTPSLIKLTSILKDNGLTVEIIRPRFVSHRKYKIALGLRKDIRESIPVARSIIAAIAYAAENNLVVEENFKFNIVVRPSTYNTKQI